MAVSIQQQVAVNIQLLFPMRSREYYIRLLIPITYAIQNCNSGFTAKLDTPFNRRSPFYTAGES